MKFFKKMLKTKKVRDLSEKAGEVFDVVKETAGDVAVEMKEKAGEIKEKVEGKIEAKLEGKISYNTFSKIEIRVGEILSVKELEKSKKLLLLRVDLGEEKDRKIVSGIKEYYENPEEALVGKQALFVANMEAREIFGHTSDGMILAVSEGEKFSIFSPKGKFSNGARIK